MVIDSSALLAIVLDEEDRILFRDALAEATMPVMSAATFVEVGIAALNRDGEEARASIDMIVAQNGIRILPVDEEIARLAVHAWDRFGRGRHPAKLNYGDCFSYALAKTSNDTLLFKGDDFTHTDIEPALSD